VRAQELVRKKEDLGSAGIDRMTFRGIRDVQQISLSAFDAPRYFDIGNDDRTRVLRLPFPQLNRR